MISRDVINSIIETASIEEVIGEFINLRKRGANYWACCPFHDEKTPSFSVSPSKKIYKCFGCGKSGNVINFIMEHEKINYYEAIKYLAKKYNIPIKEDNLTQTEQTSKDIYYYLNNFANRFFNEQLHLTDEGKAIGLSYFKERGFSPQTIEKFQLGYSPNNKFAFFDACKKNGYNLEYAEKLGLLKKENNSYYDVFRSRVIFPIHDLTGKIIGFGGRALVKSDKIPKYINSPESEIYNKRLTLYGIYYAKKAITQNDECYLVEGYTDVISLHQAGLENVVASSGTSLTVEQIRLIKRFTKNLTIIYDGDFAGIKAALRGINLALEEGMNVRIVLMPEGEDPDSFVKKNTYSDVITYIKQNTFDFIDFKTRLLIDEVKNDPIKKASLIKEISETIALIPDRFLREAYAKRTSEKFETDERYLIEAINSAYLRNHKAKLKSQKEESDIEDILTPTNIVEQQINHDPFSSEYQEKNIIRLLLLYGNRELEKKIINENNNEETIKIKVIDYIFEEIHNDEITFENPIHEKILSYFKNLYSEGIIPDEHFFISLQDNDVNNIIFDIISSNFQLSYNWEKKFNVEIISEEKYLDKILRSSILSLKLKKAHKILRTISKEIDSLQNEEETMEKLKIFVSLKKITMEMEQELGRIINS